MITGALRVKGLFSVLKHCMSCDIRVFSSSKAKVRMTSKSVT